MRHLQGHRWTSVHLVAAGKAAASMSASAVAALGDRLRGGVVIAPEDHRSGQSPLDHIVGGHPIPDSESERGGRAALNVASRTGAGQQLLVLLSGGASALMAVPADGVSLDDKRRVTDALLRGGADIHGLNAVRKHLSAIKGGRLAAATAADVVTLAISDVVGDDLSVIGSGPTVADGTTFDDALEVLERHADAASVPPAVFQRLTQGAAGRHPETPKPGNTRLARSNATVIASRHDAMHGAADQARILGYEVVVIGEPVVGEARHAADAAPRSTAAYVAPGTAPLCVVSSGETVVRVTGAGRGGRNQEFALALAVALAGESRPFVAASVGTDGVDGPTDAAGAVIDHRTLDRAAAIGTDPHTFLRQNDAYHFFAPLGDLIHTGATGTNVGDLQVMLFDKV
jgi:hydroxypyruvate reductase